METSHNKFYFSNALLFFWTIKSINNLAQLYPFNLSSLEEIVVVINIISLRLGNIVQMSNARNISPILKCFFTASFSYY